MNTRFSSALHLQNLLELGLDTFTRGRSGRAALPARQRPTAKRPAACSRHRSRGGSCARRRSASRRGMPRPGRSVRERLPLLATDVDVARHPARWQLLLPALEKPSRRSSHIRLPSPPAGSRSPDALYGTSTRLTCSGRRARRLRRLVAQLRQEQAEHDVGAPDALHFAANLGLVRLATALLARGAPRRSIARRRVDHLGIGVSRARRCRTACTSLPPPAADRGDVRRADVRTGRARARGCDGDLGVVELLAHEIGNGLERNGLTASTRAGVPAAAALSWKILEVGVGVVERAIGLEEGGVRQPARRGRLPITLPDCDEEDVERAAERRAVKSSHSRQILAPPRDTARSTLTHSSQAMMRDIQHAEFSSSGPSPPPPPPPPPRCAAGS